MKAFEILRMIADQQVRQDYAKLLSETPPADEPDLYAKVKRTRDELTIADYVLRLCLRVGLGAMQQRSAVFAKLASGPEALADASSVSFSGNAVAGFGEMEASLGFLSDVALKTRQVNLPGVYWDEALGTGGELGPPILLKAIERVRAVANFRPDLFSEDAKLLAHAYDDAVWPA